MKKLIITAIVLICGLSSNAQLRVNKNGNVSIQTSSTPMSSLTIYGEGDSTFNIHSNSNNRGIYCSVFSCGKDPWAYAAEF